MIKATTYKAVNVNELRQILKNDCSPDSSRHGYVIGPDVDGRLCHVASCYTMAEAEQLAEKMNANLKSL